MSSCEDPIRTELFRVVIEREYRPTLVRPDHNIRALDARERVRDLFGEERLPLALD